MFANDLSIHTSVLALLRGDLTAGFVADRFGVTDAEVLEWRDTFVAAGGRGATRREPARRRGTRKRGHALGSGTLEPATTDGP
jgi:hypothetical protein